MSLPSSIAQIAPIIQQNLNELNYKESCLYATTGDLSASLSTDGQTLTAGGNGALVIDGSDGNNNDPDDLTKDLPDIVVGHRILFRSQTDVKQNGIYTV